LAAANTGNMIHVIGNAAVDSVIRVDRFPRPGETIVALGASEDLGGKGANQAVAAARCGAQVRLVVAIGADAQGERIRSNLAAEGVLTDGLATSSYGTDRCVITVDGQGENTILSLINAARNFDPIAETSVARWIMPGDWVVMQGNLRPNVTRDCLALAKSKGATTALNPSPTYAAQDYDWTLVDLVLVNRGEAIELVGGGVEEASRRLCKKGAGAVVLTLGADGAAFFSTDDAFRVAPPKVIAIDAVGAGDVFCGVLIAAKVLGFAWREALAAGTEAASVSAARAGVLASFPSREAMAGILKRVALGRREEHRQ
jgi:ribokinase